ncbi:MAG: septum formation initiator family protein [bacterium]
MDLGSFKNISLGIVGATVLVSVFFLYLGQINSAASRVYEIQELESEKDMMHERNEFLKLGVAQLKSMEKIGSRITALNLVKSGETVYLTERDVVVAAN